MNQKIVFSFFLVLGCATFANAGTMFILDDGVAEAPHIRVRRDTGYAPAPAPAYGGHGHPKGRVGPVYTFVKTDPKANFKWGVRHRAGVQYGKREAVSRMVRQAPEGAVMARQDQEDQDDYKYAPVDLAAAARYLVIDLAAHNGMDMSSFSGLPIVQNPGLARMARQVQEDQDSYQYAPIQIQADPRDDSALAASGPPQYGPPAAAPHAGPDHVDYGAYTGGYGAFGWYTDHPVLLGPGHRRRRHAPVYMGDDFQIRPSRFA